MISRGFSWLNENIEHSDADHARASALAKKWSELQTIEEHRRFARESDYESGYYNGPEACEECEGCLSGGECEVISDIEKQQAARQAERNLEIELIEDKLDAIGARMMRPYEHWNEDERYMEYMETRGDY